MHQLILKNGEENRNTNKMFSGSLKIAPLSYSQLQMWIIDRIQPGNHAYNMSVGFLLIGEIKTDLLERSFNEIIRRHETLRTSFTTINDEPHQVIHPEHTIKINIIDLQRYPSEQNHGNLNRMVYEEAVKHFDLTTLPLIRITIFKRTQRENILFLNLHHIISDGTSLSVIFRELAVLYNSYLEEIPSDLPGLPVQYSDYVNWQNKNSFTPPYQEQLNFWKNYLAEPISAIELPIDKPRRHIQSLNGANEFFFLPNSLASKLQSTGIKKGCSFFMTILAAFKAFLWKYSCGEDMVIGTPVSNRPRKEDENLIGNFLNIVAIRTKLDDDPTFNSLLQRTQKNSINALMNRELPFETVVEHLKIKRDPSRNPVFQVMLQVLPKYTFQLNGLEISNFNFDPGYSQFDLSLHLYQVAEGYNCRFEYSTDLFNEDTIKRMASNFQFFLKQLPENTDSRISSIPFIAQEERDLLLEVWNETKYEIPQDVSFIKLFEKQALLRDSKPAVQSEGKSISYKELNARSNLLANYLLANNLKAGSIVGICMERSADMLIAMLAVLKSGAAYLPLDPSFPPERLEYISEDAGISMLVTSDHLKNVIPGYNGTVIRTDKEWEIICNGSDANPEQEINPSDLAYVIYTSGSSGKPKGVMVEHQAVLNFLLSMQQKPGLTEKDVLLAVTTISFDISVLELFLPLISGAKIVLALNDDTIDGKRLLNLIKRSDVTIMQATPSTWKLLLEAGWTKTADLKMLCGGEALTKELAMKMLRRGKELWNMYGPTETTVWSSVKKIYPDQEFISIGDPVANTQFYITDNNFNLVPVGVPGELLIGGSGLAKGYLNRDDLNNEKFIPDPFSISSRRLYRTGDLVRRHSNGDIEFIGRTDFQVKLRGYRIEPGEIEEVLNANQHIKDAAVTVYQRKNGDRQLAAYIIPADGKDINSGELRNFLRTQLPDYMIPSVYVKMEKFPLTPNNKIDRKALPHPDQAEKEIPDNHTPPSTELEKKIAEIWEKILGVRNISAEDNFFDLGGHSLLAVRMFAELKTAADVELPLVTLFEHQNIRELASVIESGNYKDNWSSLIRIKNGSKTPLFLIHGAEGNILLYKDLAEHLNGDQAFYALQSRGLDGSGDYNTTIEKMAEEYIKELKKVQPAGPYNLGGYCMGGTIAYEMAQQLANRGEQVKNVFLIETYNICTADRVVSNKMSLVDKIENLKFHLDNVRILKGKDKIQFIRNKTEILRRRMVSALKLLLNKTGIHVNDTGITYSANSLIRQINDKAQTDYRPYKYNGKVVLLKPEVNYSSGPDPKFGWENLMEGEFRIYNLPIAPRGMLYNPFAEKTAEIITRELEN